MKGYSFDIHSSVSTHQCTCRNAKRIQHVSVVRALTFVSVILLATALVSHSWYDLNIDLNNCSSCGTLIIAVGDAFFHSLDTNFTVQDYVRISIGMRGVIMCTAVNVCLDMTLCTASQHLESVQFVKHALG